jgi:hypothetical protein
MAKGIFANLKGVDAFGKVRNPLLQLGDVDFSDLLVTHRRQKMSRSRLAQALFVCSSFLYMKSVVYSITFYIVTILSAAIILAFTAMEFIDYRRVYIDTSLVVDKSRGEKLTVNLNITFPRVPCYRMCVFFLPSRRIILKLAIVISRQSRRYGH